MANGFSTEAFTTDEQSRIKHFLGYPDWASLSNGIQLGFPAGAQPLYLVEQSFSRITPAGRASVRQSLCQCEDIERQLSDARSRMRASKVGSVSLRADEPMALRQELAQWSRRIADDLGAPINPYSLLSQLGTPGGMNASVT